MPTNLKFDTTELYPNAVAIPRGEVTRAIQRNGLRHAFTHVDELEMYRSETGMIAANIAL